MGLGYISRSNAPFPAVNNRLFPSISANTAAPGDVIPENGNGLGYFAAPPPEINRRPQMRGLGMLTPWPTIPTEWDLIKQEAWTDNTLGLKGLGATDDPLGYIATTVQRINSIALNSAIRNPADSNSGTSMVPFAQTLASYYGPDVAATPEVQDALSRFATREQYYFSHYPGTTVLPQNATMPSGSSGRPPIVIAYNDGSFAYAPGYGPVSQYGANQVPSSSVPASPRVSAYNGQIVGTASSTDVVAALIGAPPGQYGPGYIPPSQETGAPPPPSNYVGPLVDASGHAITTGSTPTATTPPAATVGGFTLDTNTMLMGAGVLLVLMVAMKR